MKHLRITIQGKVFEVNVEMLDAGGQPLETEAPLSVMPASTVGVSIANPSGATGEAGAVPSPLAGKIVSVQASKGQAVKQGDQLLILEAMKMNTYLYAPQDGTVAQILVAVGDAVAEGQTLLRIE